MCLPTAKRCVHNVIINHAIKSNLTHILNIYSENKSKVEKSPENDCDYLIFDGFFFRFHSQFNACKGTLFCTINARARRADDSLLNFVALVAVRSTFTSVCAWMWDSDARGLMSYIKMHIWCAPIRHSCQCHVSNTEMWQQPYPWRWLNTWCAIYEYKIFDV